MKRMLSLSAALLVGFSARAAGEINETLPPLSLWSGEGHVLPVGTLLVNFLLLVGIIAFLVRERGMR